MALKAKIDESAFKKLSEELQGEYKKQDDGSYALDLEGAEDTSALKRAKDHEKAERKKAEDAAKAAQAKLEETQAELEELRTSAKGGDDKVSATERAWQAKLAKREKELQAQVDQSNKALREQMVDSVAMRMATEIAGDNAEIILPHITRRLSAEVVDGKAVTRVLDADGAVSALKPEELQKEFLSNDRFSAIVVASRASGSGAGGGRKGGGATSKRLSEMSATEEAKFANEKPAEYQQMLAAEQG